MDTLLVDSLCRGWVPLLSAKAEGAQAKPGVYPQWGYEVVPVRGLPALRKLVAARLGLALFLREMRREEGPGVTPSSGWAASWASRARGTALT
jgi:hypothetical protein